MNTHTRIIALLALAIAPLSAFAAGATPALTGSDAVIAKFNEYKAADFKTAAAAKNYNAANAEFFAAHISEAANLPEKVAGWLVERYLKNKNADAETLAWDAADHDLAEKYAPRLFVAHYASADTINGMLPDPDFAAVVSTAARRLQSPDLLNNYYQSLIGKGATAPTYRTWFNAKLKATGGTSARLALLNLELAGQVPASPGQKADAWIDGLVRARDILAGQGK